MADEQKEPTKRDLLEALSEALEKSNQLAAQNAEALVRAQATIEEQSKLIDELRAGASPPQKVVPQPAVQAIPYKGYVRAKEACYIGFLRSAGEVFQHETPCLWADDPFEPVNVVGTRDDGQFVIEPWPEGKQPVPVPFHLRPRSVDALAAAAATPRRASEW